MGDPDVDLDDGDDDDDHDDDRGDGFIKTCGEDREVVAMQVNRVSHGAPGAVRVHQEHLDHLGGRESLDWKKVKGNDQNKVKVGRK